MLIPYDLFQQPFTIRSIRFAQELGRRGHRVTMLFRPRRGAPASASVRERLPPGFDAIAVDPWRNATSWGQIWRAIAAADVVHFQKSKPPFSWAAMTFGVLQGKPLHQDWDDWEGAFWWQVLRDAWQDEGPWARRVGPVAKAAVATALSVVTEWTIPKVVSTLGGASMTLRKQGAAWGTDPAAIFPARVGVDADEFHPGRRDEALRAKLGLRGPTVIYAGSLDVLPDLEFFVRALRVLVREAPDACCLVVGGGFGRERFLARLGRDETLRGTVVTTPGLVPFGEMPRYLASCEVAALPFRDTNVNRAKSSLTLVECMASALAVVTHDVGDTAFTLGGCGEVASSPDPEAFGRLMAALCRDPERRARLGQQARERAAAHFTWARSVDSLEAAYSMALARRSRGPK